MFIIAAANKRLYKHLSNTRSQHTDKPNPHKVHIFVGNINSTVIIKQKRLGYNSGIPSQQNCNRNNSIEMHQC